jgi:hypothetical protein
MMAWRHAEEGQRRDGAGERRDENAVSVCHQVPTIGQRSSTTTRW